MLGVVLRSVLCFLGAWKVGEDEKSLGVSRCFESSEGVREEKTEEKKA